jgi:3-oxoacyl-[acyl-carrier protein] reductase
MTTPDTGEFSGLVALVTGGASGIGLATARLLAARGAQVAILDREIPSAAADGGSPGAAADGGSPGHSSFGSDPLDAGLRPLVADVTDDGAVRAAVADAIGAFGGLDILVNNVGAAKGSDIVQTTDVVWHEAFDQTLFPAIRASRLAVPHMRRRGGGAIVMIASIWGRESGGRMTYNAVKAAEISLAKAMAQQLAADNIRVNSVAPGSIRFPGGSWDRRVQEDPAGMAEFVRRELPFGRFGRPEEVGAVVTFLVSSRASWISGASVTVDGCQSRSLI